MNDNRLTVDQVNALAPGDRVTFRSWRSSWIGSDLAAGQVAKLTPKQVVVHHAGINGTVEVRFRREDGGRIGDHRGELLDPAHPLTIAAFAEKRRENRGRQIDALAVRWSRDRENLDALRELQGAISEYLDAR